MGPPKVCPKNLMEPLGKEMPRKGAGVASPYANLEIGKSVRQRDRNTDIKRQGKRTKNARTK